MHYIQIPVEELTLGPYRKFGGCILSQSTMKYRFERCASRMGDKNENRMRYPTFRENSNIYAYHHVLLSGRSVRPGETVV